MKSHHTVELEVGIEPDRSVSAVEGEGDIRHVRPPPLLKVFLLAVAASQIRGGRK